MESLFQFRFYSGGILNHWWKRRPHFAFYHTTNPKVYTLWFGVGWVALCRALQAPTPPSGTNAGGEGGLCVAAGQALDTNHVVAADRLDYLAKCSHVR